MENQRQTISAIIPARNEEDSIARAVESVASQAEIAEVIVVDDESTDRTPEILSALKSCLALKADSVALIKPQFEVGKGEVGRVGTFIAGVGNPYPIGGDPVAIDLDPAHNPFGGASTMCPEAKDAFAAEGWLWGGAWAKPDGMHFQAATL